jgi:hypothetical protein
VDEVYDPDSGLQFGGVASMYSSATAKPFVEAYSFSSFNCAGIEKPSFSCSLEETRA